MKDQSDKGVEYAIPLQIAFGTLQVLSDQSLITGLDRWRHSTGHDSLAAIDTRLSQTVQKQPPSKFGHAETPSLWTATHFYVALPMLSYVLKKYGKDDETTRNIILSHDELKAYLPAFPYILRHYHEYRDLTEQFGEPNEAWWTSTLLEAFSQNPLGTPAAAQLESLPSYLREKASLVLSGQSDSMTGRIILAYLLGQGTRPEQLSFDARTNRYLAPIHETAPTHTLFGRLIAALNELAQLDPFLHDYEQKQSLTLGAFLDVVSWYGRPHLVEMMLPGLTGAAEATIHSMSTLFADIVKNGGPDYLTAPISELPSVQKFFATQSLETIGRLSIIKDILTHQSKRIESDGSIMRVFAQHSYSESERKQAWGNSTYYIPDANRSDFTVFRQDIANIIYCAGLFAEDNNMAGTVDPDGLKQFAQRILRAKTMTGVRKKVNAERSLLDNLAVDWEVRYPGHERLRLLRLVRESFGLDSVKPIPIPLTELNKGFSKSYHDGHVYHLHYQEAGEKLEMAITTRAVDSKHLTRMRYRTLKDHELARVTVDGLPYSAWLEITHEGRRREPIIIPVPGRGSFDPFGRVGSIHAGEVIGFGCSVHHASLAVILAELASLGASKGDLEQVAAAFMRINQTVHERYDLAAFQLAQIVTAFEDAATYTYRDYLASQDNTLVDSGRPHLAAYARIGRKSLAWAEPPAARLIFGYPALYAAGQRSKISPRRSWYDGHSVELPDTTLNWQVLTC
jgi:hypothetical protein